MIHYINADMALSAKISGKITTKFIQKNGKYSPINHLKM